MAEMLKAKIVYGTIVWIIATLFVIYAFCLNTAGAVFSEAIKTSFHVSDVAVSIAAGAFILGFACMQIPAGYLLDRYNARYILSSGILLLALGNIIISYSANFYVYCFANLLQGMGASFDFIAACVLISQWFSAKMFPIPQAVSLKKSLSIVLKNKQTWFCAIAAATSFGVLLAYGGLWYLQVQTYYALATIQAAIIGGMVFLGIGIGTPILGWLSNHVKSRKLILSLTLLLGNMCLLLALYFPHLNINTLIIIKIISFILGFLLSGSMLIYTIVSEMSSNSTRGVAISITNSSVFLFNTAILLIPYLFVTQVSVTFYTHLWVLPFCVMIAILFSYFIKETY